jgi:hypothetical protein
VKKPGSNNFVGFQCGLLPALLSFLFSLLRDLFICAKHLFVAAMAMAMWPDGNKPRPGAGGRAWPGPQLAERIKHRPLRSACGRDVGGDTFLSLPHHPADTA